jgi:hypothetical protein
MIPDDAPMPPPERFIEDRALRELDAAGLFRTRTP